MPQGILRSRLTFVKHAAGTQSGRLLNRADFLFFEKRSRVRKKTTSNSFVCLTFGGAGVGGGGGMGGAGSVPNI